MFYQNSSSLLALVGNGLPRNLQSTRSVEEMKSRRGHSLTNSHLPLFALRGSRWLTRGSSVISVALPLRLFLLLILMQKQWSPLCYREALTHACQMIVRSGRTFLFPSFSFQVFLSFSFAGIHSLRIWEWMSLLAQVVSFKQVLSQKSSNSWRQKDAGMFWFASQTMSLLQDIKAKQCLLPNLSSRNKTQTTL